MQIGQHSKLAPSSEVRLADWRNLAQSTKSNSNSPLGADFTKLLFNGVSEVNALQHDSEAMVQQMLSGAEVNSAEVLTSVQKADMSFRLLVQMRNKLMQAYEEINAIRI